MSRAFADIAFTDSVKAAQQHYGSRRSNEAFEVAAVRGDALGPGERAFIESRDGFYQATVGDTGWPYVQFRGGPAGFLRVLDARTIAFADFRGNVQYLSVGNLRSDGRIALILMDYAMRRRLKLWGRARIVDAGDDRRLIAALEVPGYRARVERAIVIAVEAFDWNCPSTSPPRYTAAEIDSLLVHQARKPED